MWAAATAVSLAFGLAVDAASVDAESSAVKLKSIRSYNTAGGAGIALVQVTPGSLCNTATYKIDFSLGESREVFATVLTASNGDQYVAIEVAGNTGCTGWGAPSQSIFLLKA